MSKMIYYYDLCKDCEHLYHCLGKDICDKIADEDTDDMYLHHGICTSYYPEINQ